MKNAQCDWSARRTFWIMSHDVQLSPATSNAPIVTLPSLAPAGHATETPACHSRGPGPIRRRPGARPATEQTTSGRRAAAPARQARPRYGPPSTCEVPPICLALTSRRPAPSPGTGQWQHHNHAGASDAACHGGDDEAPGRSPAESYFRAPQASGRHRRYASASGALHSVCRYAAGLTPKAGRISASLSARGRPAIVGSPRH
jgi:hypothetical protein